MNPLISIIIPVYCVENYINKCIKSVLGQTYMNLEVLIIDDESPDKSGEIADRFAEADPRIKVFHINNSGAAGARNVGLENCSGEYVMFVDSDDWLELNAVEILLNAIKTHCCDIVQCQYYDEFTTESVPHTFMKRTGTYTGCEFAKDMLSNWEDVLLWNKLFSVKVVSGIRLEEGHCIDDEFFTYKAVINSEKIEMIDSCLYHYRNRKSSAMNDSEKYKKRLLDQIDFVTKRYKPLCVAYPQLKDRLLEHLLGLLMAVMRNGAGYSEVYTLAKNELKEYGLSAILNHNIDINIRKSICYYLLSPRSGFDRKNDLKTDKDNYFD